MSGGHEEQRPRLSVVEQVHGDRIRLLAAGEIDLDTAPRLRQYVDGALRRQPVALTVDLRDVGFLDSSGIRELVAAYQQAAQVSARLTVAHCAPMVRRVLEVTGVWSLLAEAD